MVEGRMSDDATVAIRPQATRPDPGARVLRIMSWLLGLAGLAFLLLGLGLLGRTTSFLGRAVETEALVARLVENRGADLLYTPVFAFKTPDGRLVEVTHSVATNPPAWGVGERVALLYDPEDPSRASPRTWLSLWLLPTIFTGLGVALLAGCVACRLGARRIVAGQAPSRAT
jgi:hypothetical protein